MSGTCTIILAAGRSERFGGTGGKIWALIGGVPVIVWSLQRFSSHPEIDHIVLVGREQELPRLQELAKQFQKVVAVVQGGNERWESVRAGLDAIPPGDEWVLVHDAARPAVSTQLISRVLSVTKTARAAVPALLVADTVKYVGSNGLVKETLPRELHSDSDVLRLTYIQTPQGFAVSVLRNGYERYFGDRKPTDDAQVVENDTPVQVVEGDPDNIKLTYPEDLPRLERILLQASDTRTGFGYDVHPFAEGRKLMLGGIPIPHPQGLAGHSDADVVLHALIDALLGASGMDDIGTLFPNTDPAYRDADSAQLLQTAWQKVCAQGWRLVNVDATVLAEAPRIRPFVTAMRDRIAAILQTDRDRINIKATTSEGMGFVGRGEGIACYAIATLRRLSAP